jgi:hypothetical protein
MLIIRPETLVRWHRAGLRHYWRWFVIALAPLKTAAKKGVVASPRKTTTKAASRESAVNSGRPDFISALLPSDARKRNVALERPQPRLRLPARTNSV